MRTTNSVDVSQIINEAPIGRLQWRIIAILFLIAMLDGFDTQAIAFVAPAISAEWKISPSAFGAIFSAGLLGTVFGAPLFGTLGDRFGRKIMILASILEFSTLTLLCTRADSVQNLLILRFLAGLGLGGAVPIFLALASEFSPDRKRQTMITMTMCGFPLGAVVGGLSTGGLIDQYGWQTIFYIGGILPLLLLPLIAWGLPESIRFLALKGKRAEVAKLLAKISPDKKFHPKNKFNLGEPESNRTGVKALFSRGLASGTLLLWTTSFSSLVVTYGLINWIPSLLSQKGFSTQNAVMGTVALNFAGIAGSLVFSFLMNNKRHAPLTASIAYALGAGAVASIGMVGGEYGATLLSISLAGFFIIGAQLTISGYATTFYPTAIRGTGGGWLQTAARSGSLVGPLVGGLVLTTGIGPSQMFQFSAIPAIVSACALFAFVSFGCEQKSRQKVFE